MSTTVLSKAPAPTQTAIKPTFVFIGADRCGSKSLHNIFQQHPQCYVLPIADPLFFDRHYDRGLDWYYSLFSAAPPTSQAIGEFSHDYIHSFEAAQRMATDLPDVKLLATLRHPIERTFSSYSAAFSAGVIRTSFEQALDEVPILISRSHYAEKLESYLELFGHDRLKVLFFDDLERDPKSFAAEAFQFLGLNVDEGINYDQKISQLSAPQFPLSGMLSRQAANLLRRLGWVNLLGRLKSNPRIRSLFYRPYVAADKPQIKPETRLRLREAFAPTIDRLEQMFNRDLTAWRS